MWAKKLALMQEASGSSTALNAARRMNQLLSPKLIILSIACEYEVHGNLLSPLFEKQSPWTKTL